MSIHFHYSLRTSTLFATTFSGIIFLSGCSNTPLPCENILEVKQQRMECESLRKTMAKSNYPQQALTAKLRYEEACLNLRYYRDEYDTICKKNEKAIGESEDDIKQQD